MDWLVFSYSLSARSGSTPRVTLWRRLRRLGAISPTGSVYILPANEESQEAFQWLAQEIQQAGGETVIMEVQRFAGIEDRGLIALFNRARREEYEEIGRQLDNLEQQLAADAQPAEVNDSRGTLDKLQKQYSDISRIDYFQCPQGLLIAAQLNRIVQRLIPTESAIPSITPAALAHYQDKQWVTRPRPHVDRLACAWLIRRFINPDAVIRYATQSEPNEVAFDMEGAEFGHQGNLCSFEVMLRAFDLTDPTLQVIAEIVHEIDLRDGLYMRPQTAGIDAVLNGWLRSDLADEERETYGIALFEGLYSGGI
jgi:hypothetical protein